jgi:pycsar effector protein
MSKHNGDLVRSAREHVFALFRRADHGTLEYHQFARTRDVVEAAKEIARRSDLDDGERELVLLCAWFYDACYAVGSDDHDQSRALLVEFLEQQHVQRPTAEQVAACFRGADAANGAPADGDPAGDVAPSDVLHDGTLAVLASEDFVEQAELLRLELQRRSGKTFSEIEWTQHCIAFVDAHPYRTRFAQLAYSSERAANLARLQKALRRQQQELESTVATRVGKGAETMFYHFTRIQLGVLGLADRRNNTMIHVNAIMISVVVALLAGRIETDRDLLLPTVLLLCVNVTVVLLAIYSMRGGRRAPMLSAEEADAHDANLLTFTNHTPVSLSDFTERMNGFLTDPQDFQRKVIENLYFGRRVLTRRAKALRLTYGVFMYGIAAAVLAFIVAMARR